MYKHNNHSTNRRKYLSGLILSSWFAGGATLIFLAQLPFLLSMQILLGTILLIALTVLYGISRFLPADHQALLWIRLGVILISTFLGWRYFYWRATETMPFGYGIMSSIAGLLLYSVEMHGFITFLFGHFINIHPLLRQPAPLPEDPADYPSVDVLIPTYNEDVLILRPTIIAATQIRYPAGKLNVWILDDGGTAQKRNDPDPDKAAAAQQRADKLRALAAEFGAGYITRERNEHAKAGNINFALLQTHGDLVAILDCDHIPTEDFLENSIGFFERDEKLFLLQTPHNFVSADPVEKNLNIYGQTPSENELFYRVMQPGLDFWGTSFFCGSAAVLRRKVLTELGGFAGQTITEDAETTLDAIALGYRTAYLNKPMVSGLQPETYSGLIIQRVRWAQGMLQIFLLKNPWRQRGLSFVQCLLYTNFAIYWWFAVSRLLLLLAPPAFLIFGVDLCDTSADQLMAYAGPYLFASLVVSQFYYRTVRWPFVSQIYETVQSFYLTGGTLRVLLKPRAPSFQVTPKGEQLERAFISSLSWPFYILLGLNVSAIFMGVIHYETEPWHQGAVAYVLFWAALDCLFLLAALGVTLERQQRRAEPRVPYGQPVELRMEGQAVLTTVRCVDISHTGAGVLVDNLAGHTQAEQRLQLFFPERGSLTAVVQSNIPHAHGQRYLGLNYIFSNPAEERLAVSLAFGSSAQLARNNLSRHGGKSILAGFLFLVRSALMYGFHHLWTRIAQGTVTLLATLRRTLVKLAVGNPA
ncbi:MAG: UDP-forming cellulose synthase catalytic subunit [Sulfuricella sp.]